MSAFLHPRSLTLLILCQVFSLNLVFAADSCEPVAPGESALFSGTGSRGTPVDAEYVLSRDRQNPNLFTAQIRLRFSFQDKTLATEIGSQQWPNRQRAMEAEVNQCLATVNPHLLGPDGKHLKITLKPDSTLAQGPVVNIKVYDQTIRPNENEWNAHPDCEIVTHEILHVLGLVDGYAEADSFGAPWATTNRHLFDCRSIAPEDSVMREPYQTLKPGESLLYEEEFKTITAGKSCSLTQSKYLECAQNAQQTSHLFLGVRSGCIEVQSYCQSPGWLGAKF